MTFVQAEVISTWTVTNDGPSGDARFVPRLSVDHAMGSWSDTTGQHASIITSGSKMVVLEILVEESVLADIEADPRCAVLWSSRGDRTQHRDRVLARSEWSRLREFLAAKGADGRSVDGALGTTFTKKTRRQLANDLKAWLRGR